MARRRHKRNPRSKYKVRHVVLKKNGSRRRLRRNGPTDAGTIEAEAALAASAAGPRPRSKKATTIPKGEMMGPFEFIGPLPPARGYRAQQARDRKANRAAEVKRLRRLAKSTRKGAKGRGVTAIAKRAQAQRLEALAAVLAKRGKAVQKSPLIKAMTIKSNGSLVESAKIIAPVALVGAGGLVALTMAGRKVADMLVMEKDKDGNAKLRSTFADDKGNLSTLGKYSPALATAALSAVAFVVADKVAPRYKGAIAIGGMIGAIVQAVGAAAMDPSVKDDSLLGKAKKALSLGEYTTVGAGIFHGVGEYTTVGSGIFRGIGEYTTVGQAHPFRPRNFGDNQMEWAATGGLGAGLPDRGGHDNATEFAPGEGGIFAKTPMLSR